MVRRLLQFLVMMVLVQGMCALGHLRAQQPHFPDHILDALNATQEGNALHLSWTMGRGVICINIDVHRSINRGAFERVFAIGGVCGSPDAPITYRFEDEHLQQAGTYTYRITFGSVGEASLSVDFAPLWAGNWSITRQGSGHILRVEGALAPYDVRMYTLTGNLVFEATQVRGTRSTLPTAHWQPGVYVLHVLGGGLALRQKWLLEPSK